MTERPDPPGNGTADRPGDRTPAPAKPASASSKPRPKPPASPKPGFVPAKIVFDPAYEPWHGKPALLIDVVRNLPLSERVDEFYVTFVMRADDNLPGYYGDVHFRRSGNPDWPALNQAKFSCVARVVGMTLPENPSGPAAPSRKQKVWVDTQWKGSDPKKGEKDYFFVSLS